MGFEIPEHIMIDAQLVGKSGADLRAPRAPLFTRREILGLGGLPDIPRVASEAKTRFTRRKVLISSLVACTLLSNIHSTADEMPAAACLPAETACLTLDIPLKETALALPAAPQTTADSAPPADSSMLPVETTLETLPVPTPETVPETVPVEPVAEQVNPERIPAAPETIAAIEAMNLTAEGYQNFFSRIDQSWFDYAQQFVEFNPELVSNPDSYGANPEARAQAIPQNRTEWITQHYTATYYNFEPDRQHEPVSDATNVQSAIDFQVENRGIPCCGFNFLIDRNGTAFQLAPFAAKLRHNPPFDGQTTGIEVESYYQEQLTTQQYETIAYLVIAMLQNEGLLGTASLTELYKGHGDMRDEIREGGNTKWDMRDDFDKSVMELMLPKMEAFLGAVPNIPEITQPLR